MVRVLLLVLLPLLVLPVVVDAGRSGHRGWNQL